jgi:hypothetical protein
MLEDAIATIRKYVVIDEDEDDLVFIVDLEESLESGILNNLDLLEGQ